MPEPPEIETKILNTDFDQKILNVETQLLVTCHRK